ncbi:retinol dehydratase [Danaus plexippus plexippus]|uniref:Retinol dehydratase n=1 Tax=Danaus plexippus plexippus TaxID=278856 RepID=A0A212FIH7_DANPL|nr:luciferin sulfotransferase-like [Danaus plexippus plexippus]OWR53536.1 retinol dehydratase [Danaus plexippus plexippus]
MAKDFPYEMRPFNTEENEQLKECIQVSSKYYRVGPKGYVVSKGYTDDAADIYNFLLRPDDVFVVSFPKSGTTWTQELVWLILNGLDYEKAKSIPLTERSPFLELLGFMDAEDMSMEDRNPLEKTFMPLSIKQLNELPSQRILKSHLPLSLLPPTLLDNRKVVYIARDPRDVAVSYYYHYKLMRFTSPERDFKSFWKQFINNNLTWSPYFASFLEAFEKRDHPNMLFLFYEELSKDLSAVIRKVADFFNKKLSDGQVEGLREHLKIDNFKKNRSVNLQDLQDKGIFRSEGGFIRKGKVGGWRDYFDEEMTAEAEKWINENLKGTDFRFQ